LQWTTSGAIMGRGRIAGWPAHLEEATVREPELEKQMSALSDVELVRLLTIDAKKQTPDALAVAVAEANRRGVPIDETFIPTSVEEPAAPQESARFRIAGRDVRCPHCAHDLFEARDILLNTRGMTFFRLDWLNRSATALVCANCGLVQLFAASPQPPDADS
jgi:hypothetical protein